VPRPWISPHSLPPPSAKSLEKIAPRRGAFRLVKPSGSSLGDVERPLVTATSDSGFLKFTPNRPPGHTFSFPSADEGRDRQIADRDLLRPAAAFYCSTRRRTATPAGSSRWESAGRGPPSEASRPPCGRRPRTRRSPRRSSGAWPGLPRGRAGRAISSAVWGGLSGPEPG
jgi:hypothetical protein